jgi:haloalkane dehalogenase
VVDPRLYPFAPHWFDRGGGIRMHYADEGTGEPVVMVHGNPTWGFYFRHLAAALRDTHRVVVPDHVGCGLSDKPLAGYGYTLAERVDDLTALLAHTIPTGKVNLVVHDWGGMIGLAWAVRHAERVARLVILNTAGFGLPPGRRLPFALWLGRNTALGEWLIRRFNLFAWAASRVGTKRHPLPPEVRRAYVAPYDTWENRIATARFVQTIPLGPADPGWDIVQEVSAGLERFQQTPALVCWGMRDFVFDRSFLAEWERRLPNAEFHRFADAGHYILEDARDEVVALTRQFLGR